MTCTNELKVAIAKSDDVDTEDAIQNVIDMCERQLQGANPRAGLVFCAIDYDHALVLAALRRRWPGIQLIGGTGDGFFASPDGYSEDAVAVMLMAADCLEFRAGWAPSFSKDGAAATRAALSAAASGRREPPAACWLTPCGLNGNNDALVRAVSSAYGGAVPLLGGTTGDHWSFKQSYQYCNDEILTDAVPALLVWGPLKVETGLASGWVPVGDPLTVTRLEGRELKEINGRRAFDVLAEHFGDLVRSTIGEFPFAVFPEGTAGDFYLRAIYRCCEETGIVYLTAEIPEGSTVRLTNVVRDRIVDGARSSMEQALAGWSGEAPAAAFVVSCAARKWLMGGRTSGEFTALNEASRSLPMLGFYSFGEFGRLGGVNHFHNETCVTTLLGVHR